MSSTGRAEMMRRSAQTKSMRWPWMISLVSAPQARQVLQLMKERLLTPVGLRTLAPEDIRFCASYDGG